MRFRIAAWMCTVAAAFCAADSLEAQRHADGTGRVVHHAFGVLTYDPERGQYAFRALRDGGVIDAETTLADGVFTWGFPVPGGRIRFHIRQVDGEWHETGEYSADGATWHKMLEMKLRRVGAPR
ncbi:MAG: hypothetical protein ABIV11_08240 [Gemmatimonadaceae bacterium]